jgi:hypothetical protein
MKRSQGRSRRLAGLVALVFLTVVTASTRLAFSQEPKPKVKTGQIKEGKKYTSSKGMFSTPFLRATGRLTPTSSRRRS